ncbi:M23 family metallopeptidase [uncultured Psychroserpens sp.]|uniref:M23 family metallopeptidase n=1 Tax=uncultured Psychroserpens sp. TaxID=255436 RepID=UPI002620BD23|nr:M23 family metallopeptidase [uncultured Psychroserpens sp.]
MKLLLAIFILLFSFQYGSSQSVKRIKHIDKDSIYLSFINPYIAPMEISITPLDSTRSYIGVNSYGILKEGDTLKNALIIPLSKLSDTTKIHAKSYINFKATFGDPNGIIDEDHLYELPFMKGKRYKIIQSFDGKFSHNKPHSKYAIDFGTPIGDTITAARSGRVFFVKEDSKEHCKTSKCASKGNKVLIIHDDGTMAHYVHLDFEGALVEIGDHVSVNQPIGISGMTGFTTIPHLHFVMYKARSKSIPYYFKGFRRKKLKQGKYYKKPW